MEVTGSNHHSLFRQLSDVVADLQTRGKRRYIQGVKPELQRAHPGFDEKELGFATFGDFVREAEVAGYVVARRVEGQIELSLPPDRSLQARGQSPTTKGHIRKAMWDALTNFDEGRHYFYDRESHDVVVLTEPPTAVEPAVASDVRAAVAVRDPRWLEVPASGRSLQEQWAREFLEKHKTHRLTPVLRLVLDSEQGFDSFLRVIRNGPLDRQWKQERRSRLVRHAEEWASTMRVELDLWGDAGVRRTEPLGSSASVETAAPLVDIDGLRHALHRAVDRMPAHELLALRLPVGYLFGTDA